MTFEPDFVTFKQICSDFIKASSNADLESLDAGMKCVGLHFLGLNCKADYEKASASALLRIVSKTYLQREAELLN